MRFTDATLQHCPSTLPLLGEWVNLEPHQVGNLPPQTGGDSRLGCRKDKRRENKSNIGTLSD